jgi:hypothetical protein
MGIAERDAAESHICDSLGERSSSAELTPGSGRYGDLRRRLSCRWHSVGEGMRASTATEHRATAKMPTDWSPREPLLAPVRRPLASSFIYSPRSAVPSRSPSSFILSWSPLREILSSRAACVTLPLV